MSVSVLRTSDTLGMALAVRGVGSGHPRTVWRDIRFTWLDWAVLSMIIAVFAILLYARFGIGIGAA